MLLVATTTGYQVRAFGDAAARVGVELVFATDRCAVLDDPWRDSAIPVRFHTPAASVRRITTAHQTEPFAAVLAVGDRPAILAARARGALGLPGHSAGAASAARHKVETRKRMRRAGLATPAFSVHPLSVDAAALASTVTYPVVVKPVSLSGSRGVMRADDEAGLVAAVERLRTLMARPDIRVERDPAHELLLVESFIAGHEFALEGVMTNGVLRTLAIFDKPDPLDGPFFEETIYLAGGAPGPDEAQRIEEAVAAATRAIGLDHGPVHAECRVSESGVFVLEVAARPIGGICARSLRFECAGDAAAISLEELLLRHALGEDIGGWRRETQPSGVMMIPIPRRGIYKGVAGVEAAHAVTGVDDVVVTAKLDQRLLPLPEGASYLGFIFAHGETAADVDRALRAAHACLDFTVTPDLPVLQSTHG